VPTPSPISSNEGAEEARRLHTSTTFLVSSDKDSLTATISLVSTNAEALHLHHLLLHPSRPTRKLCTHHHQLHSFQTTRRFSSHHHHLSISVAKLGAQPRKEYMYGNGLDNQETCLHFCQAATSTGQVGRVTNVFRVKSKHVPHRIQEKHFHPARSRQLRGSSAEIAITSATAPRPSLDVKLELFEQVAQQSRTYLMP